MSISHYPFPLSSFLFSPSIPLATEILVSRGYIDMLVRALVVSPILQIDFRTEQHTQHLSIGKRVCTYMYPPSIYITAALYQLNEVVPSVTDLHTTLLSYSAVLHIGVKLLYFERVVRDQQEGRTPAGHLLSFLKVGIIPQQQCTCLNRV